MTEADEDEGRALIRQAKNKLLAAQARLRDAARVHYTNGSGAETAQLYLEAARAVLRAEEALRDARRTAGTLEDAPDE